MTDTIDMAEKFHKTVYADGDMDVFGRLVHAKAIGAAIWVDVMPIASIVSDSARMSRAHAIELRDALTVLLAATGGDS